ncbi:MAG: hypothetical protein JNL70_26550 [Saprospiraceae bacterium]|nr:hypothetical protein [Saprospiraceae bacterium]
MVRVFQLWAKQEEYHNAIARTCLLLNLVEPCEQMRVLIDKMNGLIDAYNQNIIDYEKGLLLYDEYFDKEVGITGNMIWDVLHPITDLLVNNVRQN